MKAKPTRILAVLLTIAALCVAGAVASRAAVDITDEFTDLNFRAAVYEAIRKTDPTPIYDTDTAGVKKLFAGARGIESLAGLEYFTGLEELFCDENRLTVLPALPGGLTALDCGRNLLTQLPALPDNLEYLDCSNVDGGKGDPAAALPVARLTSLPALPAGLLALDCQENDLTSLPTLPATLHSIFASNNKLASLPALPAALSTLSCDGNRLKSLPALPAGLVSLYCEYNQLASLPALPPGLQYLRCNNNKLAKLDVTGLSLDQLNCSYNNISNKSAVKGFTGTWDGNYIGFKFDPQNDHFRLWGKLTNWEKSPLHWFLLIVCFGWIWMAF